MQRKKPALAPFKPARSTRTGRPLMVLLDLLGRRWALRVLWELRTEPLTFRELRARCDELSPSVLNDRLRELREAGVLIHDEERGYAVTAHGRELAAALEPLQHWADAWARRTPTAH